MKTPFSSSENVLMKNEKIVTCGKELLKTILSALLISKSLVFYSCRTKDNNELKCQEHVYMIRPQGSCNGLRSLNYPQSMPRFDALVSYISPWTHWAIVEQSGLIILFNVSLCWTMNQTLNQSNSQCNRELPQVRCRELENVFGHEECSPKALSKSNVLLFAMLSSCHPSPNQSSSQLVALLSDFQSCLPG